MLQKKIRGCFARDRESFYFFYSYICYHVTGEWYMLKLWKLLIPLIFFSSLRRCAHHQMPDLSLKMHQIQLGELTALPISSWIWGKGKGKEKGREREKRREGTC